MHGLGIMATISLLVLGGSALGAETQTEPDKGKAGTAHAAIHADAARIREHVKFLAGDRLEGRGPSERGGTLAAEYIARQFASYGLDPAGDDGSYFQDVPMVEVRTLGETSLALVSTSLETLSLRNLEDFVTNNESGTESVYLDAPLVFVGYGIEAPEYDQDDYKSTDLNGKVALLLPGEPVSHNPKFFDGKAATDYGGWAYKFAQAARHGALAALIIHADSPGDSWDVVRNSFGTRRAYLRQDVTPRLRAASWLSSEAAGKLATLAGVSLEQLVELAQSKEFRPMELSLRLQGHVVSQVQPFVARNVLAVRPTGGSESEEAVLYTTHYDHLRLDPAVAGHNIYNGAVDDATGCGVLLEVARAWARTSSAPPRMILFAALTAEDQGLLGSQYLARHSPVAPGRVSLALNYDPLPPLGDPQEVVVSGAERTTFYAAVGRIAKALGLTIRPDPEPGRYYRSSPINLARAGIPAFSITQGSRFKGHAAAWTEAQERDYVEHHRTTDVHLPGMDFAGAARLATLGYELGVEASALPGLIGWLPGDEFAAERKRSQVLDQLSRTPPLRHAKRRK